MCVRACVSKNFRLSYPNFFFPQFVKQPSVMGCTGSKEKNTDCTEADINTEGTTTSTKPSSDASHWNQPTSSNHYWNSIRNDVMEILQDLDKEAQKKSELSPGKQEYAAMLRRWLKRYRDTDPGKAKQLSGDTNNLLFPVPEDLNSLRGWLQTWEPLDTDLGEGQTAWSLLSEDVIRNGLTTPCQQGVLASRQRRRFLQDPERMRKRREELAEYFVKRYRLKKGSVQPYLRWADLMMQNQADLERLINSDSHSK